MDCTNKWVINLSKPPSPRNSYLYYKKDLILLSPPNTPIEAYITATEQASSKLPAQEAEEFRSDVNKILKQQQEHCNNQCNLNPFQCRALTQLKHNNSRVVLTVDKGWPWSSWTKRTTQTKPKSYYKTPTPIKYSQRIPPANLKTNSFPFSRTSNKQEASATTSINSYTSPVQSPQILWPSQNSQSRYTP